MNDYWQYLLDDFFYSIVDAAAFAVSIGILVRIITWMWPGSSLAKVKGNPTVLAWLWSVIVVVFGAFLILGYFVPSN